jgi:hypothetical protein
MQHVPDLHVPAKAAAENTATSVTYEIPSLGQAVQGPDLRWARVYAGTANEWSWLGISKQSDRVSLKP